MTSDMNQKRADIGQQAIDLIPGDDLETAASDLVADILHAIYGVCPEGEGKYAKQTEAMAFLNRSHDAWVGDTEDEDG